MTAAPLLRFTFLDYLQVDEASEARHEFMDGLILGMAGGTPEHARLTAAVSAALSQQLANKRCAVFSEALRVRATATGFAGYPDVTVICGSLERDPESAVTATNPSVVVEVLSPGTIDYDRGQKLLHYQQMPSLQHIVHLAPTSREVIVYTRSGNIWSSRSFGASENAALPAIECVLSVDTLFHDPLAP